MSLIGRLTSPLRNIAIKQSPKNGLGLFALQNIPAYTKLVSDKAILVLHPTEDLPEAYQQYQNLSYHDQVLFLQFHSFVKPDREALLAEKLSARGIAKETISEMVKVSSIFTSNAFNVEASGRESTFIRSMFPLISRINHSCMPNAHTNYNPDTSTMAVYTLSDVATDEEIEISYFNLLLPVDERQARAAKWGFQCTCPACKPAGDEAFQARETRRRQIRDIEQHFAGVISNNDPTEADLRICIEQSHAMIDLISEDPSLRPQLPIAYDYLAMFQIFTFQLTQDPALIQPIQENLSLAANAERKITGDDSLATRRREDKKNMFKMS